MAKADNPVVTKVTVPADVWIGRLTELLRTVEAMETDERYAAFNFLRSKYSSEWPRGEY